MAKSRRPDETGKTEPGRPVDSAFRDEDLERRRLELEAKLAKSRPAAAEGERDGQPSRSSGYGQAMKLSSEFIAGIVIGAGLGWFIDRFAGTSPWGLIVFLLLGFCAGVLNVLRSAGMVSESGVRPPDLPDRK
ncbi:AtpZ/AtpI family protein [Oryzicola mucosus]|uniref:AtpZ/AtpI family protein n=1 Tax=Oryzicola mucosus TaxID=2767425 RepID=A0A8J6U5E7_9HYPH|nr:AtpZ/AtpI family protein [Oryzicola mucosus]MBD0416080.1 AtpZ/AtpI family protein [Oryzicola mucosus]